MVVENRRPNRIHLLDVLTIIISHTGFTDFSVSSSNLFRFDNGLFGIRNQFLSQPVIDYVGLAESHDGFRARMGMGHDLIADLDL